ncbi:MAG: T9SS type A sorting domain-containing protein, partial [Bacteroidales bacterium]|nr:T9SS type A sorting domain-containing protein [Bacteroidales bacterium]
TFHNGCTSPTNLSVTGTTPTTGSVLWNANLSSAWQLVLNDSTATPISVMDSNYTFTGLNPNTTYTVYLRTTCGGYGNSEWISVSLTTDLAVEPEVTMGTITIVDSTQCTSVSLTGTIVEHGNPSAIEYGFVYGTTPNLTAATGNVVVADIYGTEMLKVINNLNTGTNYYFNAYAKKTGDVYVYGTEGSILTCNGLLDVTIDNVSINIYPNPATEVATLAVEGLTSDATLTITDLTGKVIGTVQLKADQKTFAINVKNLTSGVYYIKVINGDLNITQKLIVNK